MRPRKLTREEEQEILEEMRMEDSLFDYLHR